MTNEFLVQMDNIGNITLPPDLWRGFPSRTQFRAQRTTSAIVLKLETPAESKSVTLPMEIAQRPGIQSMVNYLATCETRYGLSSAEFYQRYSQGKLPRDGYLAYWATCYQTLNTPTLAADPIWLDALDAIAETANTVYFGDSATAIQEIIDAPELGLLQLDLLLSD